MKFINRDTELAFLNSKWQEGKANFIIIYGKRRVGKTALIKQFIKEKPAIYFLADKRSALEHMKELGRIMGSFFNDSLIKEHGFTGWLEVFRYLKERNTKNLVFTVDEYPYLVEIDKAATSVFQKGWDEFLKDHNIFFILSGSSIAMMESETLTHGSPLYGRRTGQILVKPVSFKEGRGFFPKKDFDDFMGVYTITGGMPAYLLQLDADLSIEENIKKKIFPVTEYLHNEVEFILKEEFREPKNYLSILKAIAWGKRKFGEIVNETGLEKNVLTKYLMTLERLQIIEKEVPVTEEAPHKSRKGLYFIYDNFFRFWFQYVFPYKSDLEIGNFDEVLRKIRVSFKILEAASYERVSREIVWDLRNKLFPFEKVGKWWERENEIDLVALNSQSKEILYGEVKWSEKAIGINIYEDLKKKSRLVDWQRDERKEYFALFSRSGFTKDMIDMAKKEKVFLIHKDTLV